MTPLEPRNESIEISIIIPAFNEEQFIDQTLKSLKETDFPENKFEIIVVDNGSTDNTVSIAEPLADIVAHLPDGNVGAVRNHGARLASGNVLIFIDADCTVEKAWLTQAYQLGTQQDGEIVYGGICKVRKDANWIERLWLLDGEKRYQKDLTGACIVINKDIFEAVGKFNEQITSGEDTDLSQRLKASGKTVKVLPQFYVTHLGNADTAWKFIRRQSWHGENYFHDIHNSLRDPTFLLCALTIATIPASIAFYKTAYNELSYLIFVPLIMPIIFSIKRLIYSKYKPRSIETLLKIYCLDALYVAGRCLGIIKSILYRRI